MLGNTEPKIITESETIIPEDVLADTLILFSFQFSLFEYR